MANQQTRVNSYSFAGGMNSNTSSVFMRNDECELIQNYNLDNLGSLTKRNGILYLIGQVVNDCSILGMYDFKNSNGTDYSNVLIACNDAVNPTNADIYKVSANAWAKSKEDITKSTLPVFTTFIDYVFYTNGSDVMGSSADLSSWGTTNCLATIKTKYCCVWEDRIYAMNDSSSTAYPSRIYWSSLPSGAPLAVTWTSASDYADINPDDNDEITWGEPYGQMMLIFKNKALYRWTFGQVEPDKIVNIGTPQGRTVKQLQGICFFLGNNNNKYGVYAFTGSGQPQWISKKVQSFIDAIPSASITNCRAEVDHDHYYLYIGDVTVSGTTYSNTMLVYTLSTKSWHIETYLFKIKSMARFNSKTLGSTLVYDDVYIGDDDGFIYRKGIGSSDYLGTAAKPINGKIITKEYPLPGFPNTSILDTLYFLAKKGTAAKIHFRIDGGDWKEWKNLIGRVTEDRIAGRARTIQFSITDNSTTTSQIEGFTVDVKPEKNSRRD